jgi:hypothetical protein
LHNIDDLLPKHDGKTNTRNDPWPERIHLIGSSQFQRARAIRICEQRRDGDVAGVAGLQTLAGGGFARSGGLEEGGGEEGRREGEEVEGYEEDFVEGAEEEKYGL